MEDQQAESVFEHIPVEVVPATVGQRFVNFLFDTVLCGRLLVFPVGYLLGFILVSLGVDVLELISNKATEIVLDYLIGGIVIILFYTLVEGASGGRSLGKLITKTVAVREDGQPFTFRDAFLRAVCRIIPFETLSALSGYPWHDRLTKTLVVKKSALGLPSYEPQPDDDASVARS